jgi:hypothetical protein
MKRAIRQESLATGEEAVAAVCKTFDDREEAVSHPVLFCRMCLSRRRLRDEQSQCRWQDRSWGIRRLSR